MSLTLDQLAKEAMQLPSVLRAELAALLVGSLDEPDSNLVQDAWTQEALKRRSEIRSGKVRAIPGDEVLAEARRLAGR